jgi:hypothetical protein
VKLCRGGCGELIRDNNPSGYCQHRARCTPKYNGFVKGSRRTPGPKTINATGKQMSFINRVEAIFKTDEKTVKQKVAAVISEYAKDVQARAVQAQAPAPNGTGVESDAFKFLTLLGPELARLAKLFDPEL